MAFEKYSYDPLTGVTTFFDYDEENDLTIFRREEDVSGILKLAAETRATGVNTYLGQAEEKWFPQAIIPAMVLAEMMKKGINVTEDPEAVAREIETNYKYLKLTDKHIWR